MTADSVLVGQLVGVQRAAAEPLCVKGRSVLSGIRKRPVDTRVRVGPLGLAGDEQADRSLHGGLEKALYAYPTEHFAFWDALRGADESLDHMVHGHVGENLSIKGVTEENMYVGDEWHFPDCVLRVTQPRIPCSKLNAVFGSPQAARQMAASGRCGTYLAVKVSGHIATGDTFDVLPGRRETSISSLFKVSRLKTRND